MAVWINDGLRRLLRLVVPLAARVARRRIHRRIAGYETLRGALRIRYGITAESPILDYAGTLPNIEAFERGRADVYFAETSGSTGAPKQIPYTAARLQSFRAESRDAGLRAFTHFGITRAELFVLAGLQKDRSFSSLVLHDGGGAPRYLRGLVEPARYLRHPAVASAMACHGSTAARVFLLALSRPGLLYSTNPSTLAVFLGGLAEDWLAATAMVRRYLEGGHPALETVVRRLGGRGWQQRFEALAQAQSPLPLHVWAPDIRGFCCWDGGYVAPFLAQVRRFLPADRYAHIPMYAMSTETVETLPVGSPQGLAFLPISPDVLYEFLPIEAADEPENLLDPRAVEVGQEVCMVVSDAFGLRRYQTEDVFECVGQVRGLPDLRFRRRRGLTWSFTGEKLTGAQLSQVFDTLRAAHPDLDKVPLSCVPVDPEDGLPGYVLLVATSAPPPTLATDFDDALAALNGEYRAKRQSARLAMPWVCPRPYEIIAAALGGPHWESQFKLAPLTGRLYGEFARALGQ